MNRGKRMNNVLTRDENSFFINGKPDYLISGEFHYFRVPRSDWARRMRLFREAGGNTLATYVPWQIHEPEEGNILFGDRDERDLAAFLKTAAEEGLMVTLRPGPYVYSELTNAGIPGWLIDGHPEIMARRLDGSTIGPFAVSYLHPVFLEKARKYYHAFCEVVRPFLSVNGGPVAMIQLDNELGGIHIWSGSLDYNAETMGFGRENGRWPMWLKKKYGENADITVLPPSEAKTREEQLLKRDYADFYIDTLCEYLMTLKGWLKEENMDVPLIHNSANPNMNGMFTEAAGKLGDGFLLGSDHYYTLGPTWDQNSPTPQYAISCYRSMEMLRAMGMLPTVMEMPAGNLADVPPLLSEDLYAAWMLHAAYGIKGLNYYIYTGGPNFPGSGSTCDIYDYHAPIAARGGKRESYYAMKRFGVFLQSHRWMAAAKRKTSAQLGFIMKDTRMTEYQLRDGFSGVKAWNKTCFDLLYALESSACPAEMKPVDGPLDLSKPLVLMCPERMSAGEQQNVASFVKEGGSLLVMLALPTCDENGYPCTILMDALGVSGFAPCPRPAACAVINGKKVYSVQDMTLAHLPEKAEIIGTNGEGGEPLCAEWSVGEGRVMWLGLTFSYTQFAHAEMLEDLLLFLGAKKTASSSNRNIFTSLWEDKGRKVLFVMNLFSGKQSTDITILGKNVIHADLNPMEVRVIEDF